MVHLNTLKGQKLKQIIVGVLIVIVILAVITYSYLKEYPPLPDIKIPESDNITYNFDKINSITPLGVIKNIEDNYGRPILLHFYTTWCPICKKQMPIINEAARKFQNTDLKVIIMAVQRGVNESKIASYLYQYGSIYFKSSYLLYTHGFNELLVQKSIDNKSRVPFTVVFDRHGQIITKYTGVKSQRFLNSNIMKSLIINDDINDDK